MKFGLFLNTYYEDESEFEVTDLIEQANVAEAVGFDTISIGERHVHADGVVEPLTALAAIAARTTEVDLATMAALPGIHHPIHLAEKVATIDRLAGGRMRFGTALGYRERELAPFDLDLADRVPAFLEALAVIKRLWSEPTVTHDGSRWQFENVCVQPGPIGEMPVWIGAHADIAIKRAAYRGDGWIASGSSDTSDLERQIGVYEDALAEFGKERSEHTVVLMRDCFVGPDRDAAFESIRPYVRRLYDLYERWGQTYLDEMDGELTDEKLAEKFVLGSPEACIDRLRTYEELGVDQVVVRVQFPGQPQDTTLQCLERVGNEIIPAFTTQ